MKTSLLFVFAIGATLAFLPTRTVLADDADATSAPAAANGGTAPADGQGQRLQRFKQAMEQLDLSDTQKDQIKQIRSTQPAGKERRQQIMAVLTPDQKTKLLEMIQQRRASAAQ